MGSRKKAPVKARTYQGPGRSGRLIVFEGIDGVGKTTLTALVADALNRFGQPTTTASFPGRTTGTLSAHIYDVYHQPKKFGIRVVRPASMQMLVTAAHIDVVESEVLPALKVGKNVVLDRYWWSTLVYGRRAGASNRLLEQLVKLERYTWAHVTPAVLFLVGRRSALKTTNEVRLSRGYSRLAKAESERGEYPIIVLRNESTKAAAVRQVLETLEPLAAIRSHGRRGPKESAR